MRRIGVRALRLICKLDYTRVHATAGGIDMPKLAVASLNGRDSGPRTLLDPRSPTFSRDFRRAAQAFTKRATVTPEAARAVLVKEGILTKSGKLSKNYR
jgi:hypothetical protein